LTARSPGLFTHLGSVESKPARLEGSRRSKDQ
jgi:hypothetical protein